MLGMLGRSAGRLVLVSWVGVCIGCGGPSVVEIDAGLDAAVGDTALPTPDAGRCAIDDDCDDDVFCNGSERCDAGVCRAGAAPCSTADCDETADACDCAVSDGDGDGEDAIACGGLDCDDDDRNRAPGRTEICDGVDRDEDCDLTTFGFRDADGDGYADAACCNVEPGGTSSCGTDCNDGAPNVHPTEAESCNSIDDDCDLRIDEGIGATCYVDGDRDGFAPSGAAAMMLCSCSDGTTSVAPAGAAIDCDDDAIDVNPATAEVCGNGVDDNCDGAVDGGGNAWYPDCDGDGFGDPTASPSMSCGLPGTRPPGCFEPSPGWSFVATDCDDHVATTRPGAPELCNSVNDDCDASSPDGATDPLVGAACDGPDSDGCREGRRVCLAGGLLGCDDATGDTVETCNGLDDDCDGTPDASEPLDAWCNEPGRALPFATAACDGSACAVAACAPTALDCSPAPGCVACQTRCATAACDDPTQVDAGFSHTCARLASGRVMCWGANTQGQLGDGTTTTRTRPVLAMGITDAAEVAAGSSFTCVRRAGGTVACWGYNGSGQLGDGTTTDRTTPLDVPGLTGVVDVETSFATVCALRSDRTVWCWGNAPVGDGTSTSRPSPTRITGIDDAVDIAVGAQICIVRASGATVCWRERRPGDGVMYTSLVLSPVTVSGVTDAVEVAAAGYATCVRHASGRVSCWGSGGYVGDGTTMTRLAPVAVPGLLDAVALSGSAYGVRMCAVRVGGTVSCWGETAAATAVAGLTNVVAVDGGYTGSGSTPQFALCVLRSTAPALMCWGYNGEGMVGAGTTTASYASPVAVVPEP